MTKPNKNKLANPLKWWGGKSYLADWIISLMPKHLHYVEPYAGGLAVLLAKDPNDPKHDSRPTGGLLDSEVYDKGWRPCGRSEVVNDLNGELTNFWRVLQSVELFASFQRILEAMPFSQKEWDGMVERAQSQAGEKDQYTINVFDAIGFFVRCRQSRAGGFKSFATLSRNRTRRGMNEQASAWLNAIDGLPAVHDRLKRVVILHDDALKVIRQQDGPKTLFYLDPPYVHSTRNESSTKAYEYEMSDDDHQKLLSTIRDCKGKVMLSGYNNHEYHEWLVREGHWTRHDKLIDNKLSNDRLPVIESVWTNF